ncbi:MAG: hypothetical protein V4679_13625 [Pseudomonadota bacterium]
MPLPVNSPFQGLSRPEAGLLIGACALAGLAVLGPALPADLHQHGFADQRTLLGIPCALDVLSNLPFAVAGLCGLAWWARLGREALGGVSRALVGLFFAGLLLTAVGSGVYHWHPDDAGLLWDRLGMVLPFAGLLGLAAAGRVSPRAGWAAAGTVLLAGTAAVLWWAHSGNLLPWAAVQLGGMLVVLALAVLPRRADALAVHLGAVIAFYGVAKLFEAADHAVLEATGQWVSGHSLKHLIAAGAALPVLSALAALQPGAMRHGTVAATGQNGGQRWPGSGPATARNARRQGA